MIKMGDDLEGKVKKLKERIDKTADPQQSWEDIKKEADPATEKFLDNYKAKKTDEKGYEAELEKAAKAYMKALGQKATGPGNVYAHTIKQWIGRDRELMTELKTAIKEGNSTAAAAAMQKAYRANIQTVRLNDLVADVETTDQKGRVKIYEFLAEKAGGDDYLKTVGPEQTQAAVIDISNRRERAKKYLQKAA